MSRFGIPSETVLGKPGLKRSIWPRLYPFENGRWLLNHPFQPVKLVPEEKESGKIRQFQAHSIILFYYSKNTFPVFENGLANENIMKFENLLKTSDSFSTINIEQFFKSLFYSRV